FVIFARGSTSQTTATALRPADTPPIVLPAVPAATLTTSPAIDFAAVAATVNPAVVNVHAAGPGDGRSGSGLRWRRDMPDDAGAPREGSGSGFLIDKSGFLLTNYHVIDSADRITVTLGDGRSFRAALIGVDPAIDVALLKIDAAED